MKPLSLAQMEKDVVQEMLRVEAGNACEIPSDDPEGHRKMLLTEEQINDVLDTFMPHRCQEAQIWRIVRWMQENDENSDFDYSTVFFEWCCTPYNALELKDLLRDFGDAEGLQVTHIIWFNIREWLRSEISGAMHGETLSSETEKRNEIHWQRWVKYKGIESCKP